MWCGPVLPVCRRMVKPEEIYRKVGDFPALPFVAAMMLDESACFLDPGDVEIMSSKTAGGATDSYPGLIWVAIKVKRILGIIPEKRLEAYRDKCMALDLSLKPI